MSNYTKTKPSKKEKVSGKSEDILKHVIELNSSIGYIMEALNSHAEMLKSQEHLLGRIRSRMGM